MTSIMRRHMQCAMCIGQEKILKDGQLCAATLRDRDIAGGVQVTKTASTL
ncbi:hypothetical protein M405DRAFT_820469 [Rhizopogon salebrosus TDB-379]|nr:hypothetical protein M405DRAFT_820469 [Rhizopogon salebrosus TDB-379]